MESKRPRKSETNEAKRRSDERSAKLMLLKTCQALFSKELTDEESVFWAKVLDPIPLLLLRPAFENWQRNGRFFPKPKDIFDLVEVYKTSNRTIFRSCGKCSDGWVVLTEGAMWRNKDGDLKPVSPGNKAVRRCACWQAWRAGQVA